MAYFDRFDICEAHFLIERDYNVSGVLQERTSNQRRNMSTGFQLARMQFKPSSILREQGYKALSENGKELYIELLYRYGFVGENNHICDRCGTPTKNVGYDSDKRKYCYDCCAKQDQEYMRTHDRTTLYLTNLDMLGQWGKGTVCNWPNSLSWRVNVKKGEHNIANCRYDVWFKDHFGNMWWGVRYGDNTEILHCKKLKG